MEERPDDRQLSSEAAHALINQLGVVLANAQVATWAAPGSACDKQLEEIKQAAAAAVEIVRGLPTAATRSARSAAVR